MAAFTGSRGAPARAATDIAGAIVGAARRLRAADRLLPAKYPALATAAAADARAGARADRHVRPCGGRDLRRARGAATTCGWRPGVNMAQDWHDGLREGDVRRRRARQLRRGEPGEGRAAARARRARPRTTPTRRRPTSRRTWRCVFDPSGRLVSKQVKTYLTPIELPGQLDLVPGDVMHGVSAVDTAVGRLGFVTSKDAWMPDVTERLDQEGVQILVQPEFFVGDTIRTTGPWAPDNIQGAGYSDVLRQPSMQALVLPQLTGNVFDLLGRQPAGDRASSRARARAARGALVGQPRGAGAGATVGALGRARTRCRGEPYRPAPRCGSARPGRSCCRAPTGRLPDAEHGRRVPRRPARGRDLRTTCSSARAGWRPRRRGARGRAPARSPRRRAGAQRNVALAARGRLVVAAFEQDGPRARRRAPATAARTGRAPGRAARRRARSGGRRSPCAAARSGSPRRSTTTCVWARSSDGGRDVRRAAARSTSPAETWRPVDRRDRHRAAAVPRVDRHARPLHARRPAAGRRSTARACRRARRRALDSTARARPRWRRRSTTRGRRASRRAARSVARRVDRLPHLRLGRPRAQLGRRRRDVRRTSSAVNDTPTSEEALEDSPRAALGAARPAGRLHRLAQVGRVGAPAEPALRHRPRRARRPPAQGRRHRRALGRRVRAGDRRRWQRRRDRRLAGHAPRPRRHLARAGRASRVGRLAPIDGHGAAGTPGARRSRSRAVAAIVAWEDERDGRPDLLRPCPAPQVGTVLRALPMTDPPVPFVASRP